MNNAILILSLVSFVASCALPVDAKEIYSKEKEAVASDDDANEIAYDEKLVEYGKVTGLSIPRFVALKSNLVNMRNGPADRYPIKWVYKKKWYPVQIVGEFDNWRKIRDFDGEDGWVHENLISGQRTAIVVDGDMEEVSNGKKKKYLVMRRHGRVNAYPIAKLEPGVLVKLAKCNKEWCNINVEGKRGWVQQSKLWGVMQNETIK